MRRTLRDGMFQAIAMIAFAATLAGIALHWLAFPVSGKRQWRAIELVRGCVRVLTLLLLEQKLGLLGALKKLAYLLAVVCFLVLAVTGFWPLLVRGEHISGYLMVIHATFAPVFAICLAVLAIVFAAGNGFGPGDYPWMQSLLRRVTRLRIPNETIPSSGLFWQKVTFWLVAILALPLILSIILSMFTLFGTDGQDFLLATHRYTAIAFAVTVILHTYSAVRSRLRE